MDPFSISYPANVNGQDQFWCFTDLTYSLGREKKSPQSVYVSSQFLFVGAAVELSRFFSKSDTFDIRVLSLVELAALLLLFWGIARLIVAVSGKGAWIGLALCAIICTDIGYLAFFNTFYAEPAVFIFGMAFILALIQALRKPGYRELLLLTAASTLLVLSKPQNVLLGFLLGGFYLLTPFARREWRRLLWPCVMVSGLSIGLAVSATVAVPRGFSDPALFDTVLDGILVDSPTPERDLSELGLDPAVARYRGVYAYSPESAAAWKYFPGQCSMFRVAEFFVLHPGRLIRRTSRVLREAMSNRQLDLGNFERGSGHACEEQAKCFAVWDSFRSNFNSLWRVGGGPVDYGSCSMACDLPGLRSRLWLPASGAHGCSGVFLGHYRRCL